MLSVNTDNVVRLIDLAQEFHAQEAVSFPDDPTNASGDWATQMLASHVEDATLDEFKSIVADLEPDQQQEIVALLWLGRGDFTEEEWPAALEQARDNWGENTAEYLITHPLLPDYLREGLDIMDSGPD